MTLELYAFAGTLLLVLIVAIAACFFDIWETDE